MATETLDREGIHADEALTPEIFRWAEKIARGYARNHGDPEGRYEGCIGTALYRAMRTYDPSYGAFGPHAKRVVRQAMNGEYQQANPLGFRRHSGDPGHKEGSPAVAHFSAFAPDESPDPDGGQPPVGWEVEYEDFVEGLARHLPDDHARLLRAMYLDCRAQTHETLASLLGVTRMCATKRYIRAIELLRRRFARPAPEADVERPIGGLAVGRELGARAARFPVHRHQDRPGGGAGLGPGGPGGADRRVAGEVGRNGSCE